MLSDDEFDDGDEWDVLETIDSFDCDYNDFRECGAEMSHAAGFPSEPPVVLLKDCCPPGSSNVSTPVSLLVQSLVQQLCTLMGQDPERSKQLYDSICGKLEQLQLIDKTWTMSEFDIMRMQYRNALYQLVHVAKGPEMLLMPTPGTPNTNSSDDNTIWPLPQPVTMEWSRYHKDFEELSFIAGGGFGKVFRARNKLDGIVYAVKKVIIRAKSIDNVMGHLSEVKTLASLHHINIVPYKTAWLEPLMDPTPGSPLDLGGDEEEDEEGDDDDEESSMLVSSIIPNGRGRGGGGLATHKKSSKRRFECRITTTTRTERDEDFSDSLVVFENSHGTNGGNDNNSLWTQSSIASNSQMSFDRTDDLITGQTSTEVIQSKAICPYDSNGAVGGEEGNKELRELRPHLKLKWAVLYIQMSECQLTLRTWLDDRNQATSFTEFYRKFKATGLERNRSMTSLPTEVLEEPVNTTATEPTHLEVVSDIFLQLINGLNYIHARDIIHHDIKPSNIFVSIDHDSNILVQLGDFGLACPLQQSHQNTIVGTPQYAAPEQMKGKCNKKSDVYSLGVILMELLICFKTDMERMRTVSDAKRNIFPDSVPQPFRALIRRLLSSNVNERPPSFELPEIFSRLCRTSDTIVEDLQLKIAEMQEIMDNKLQETSCKHKDLELEVQSRDLELSKKDQEILELRKKLAELKTQDKKSRKQVQVKHHENRRLKKKLDQQKGSSSDTA